jgi:hypothetical protein
MTAPLSTLTVLNKFLMDGKFKELGTSPISYSGYAITSFDVPVLPGELGKEIFLEDKGEIKRIEIINRTRATVWYRLNGSFERFKLVSKAIICQHPTELLIDNDSDDIGVVLEVKIIGK